MPSGQREYLKAAIESTVGARFVQGNQVDVLKNGVEIFPAILQALQAAKQSIDFLTFVYWKGEIARKVADTLAARARAGVRVRVLLDDYGSTQMDDALVQKMKSAGAEVERFRPVVRWKFWESDHRTHRKIIVIDDRVGFTGGVGIASEWEGDGQAPDEWRDTHFRVEGPVALELKAAFLTDWRDAGHPLGRGDIVCERPAADGDVEIAVIDGSVQIGFDDSERVLEALLAAAKHRIYLQTPYFNPTEALMRLLGEATQRGVDVSLLIPGPYIDMRISQVMARDLFEPLNEMGITVWIYQPSMMHTKALLVDGEVAMVGSINVNRRSVKKDEEIALTILDKDITATLEQHFEEDVKQSHPPQAASHPTSLTQKVLALALKPFRDEI